MFPKTKVKHKRHKNNNKHPLASILDERNGIQVYGYTAGILRHHQPPTVWMLDGS